MQMITQSKPNNQVGTRFKQITYRERLLAQKIQLLEMALKANIQNQTLESLSNVAKAKHDLLVFMRGDA